MKHYEKPENADPAAPVDQADLDAVAELFAKEIREGKSPQIDMYLEQYTDPSGQLRELLTSVKMIEQLKEANTFTGDDDTVKATKTALPVISQLGDYTIVREIGRGGMGVVFEAMHQSLGRRVAIKVLAHAGLQDNKQLHRFRTEARAAAGLRHSSIVPVFGVGNDDDTHYYVMDYIAGESLRSRIDRLAREKQTESTRQSTEHFRSAARFGEMVASGLAYAHSQGVLHRDIKPANLLVDASEQCWIADFGLAKLLEQDGVTKTGEVLGTPQYMPPEAFSGQYDARSEVYALGLTLFELIALQPAISGKGAAEILRRASRGDTQPLRQLAPTLPRDLETIVVKCLSSDPKGRYQTARDLHDDLHRFLNFRPVKARRTGPLLRLSRWVVREPVIAGLTLTSFGLLIALATVAAIGLASTRSALRSTQDAWEETEAALDERTTALQIADEQQRRAESNLQVALRAFTEIMSNVSARNIENDLNILGEASDTTAAGVSDADAELLASLLKFFDELSQNNSSHLLKESSVAAQHAAEIYVSLGQLKNASGAYLDAINRSTDLGQQDGGLQQRLQHVTLLNDLATVYSLRGELLPAAEAFESATEIVESTPELTENAEGKFQLARAHRLFASLASRSGLDATFRSSLPPSRGDGRGRGRLAQLRGAIKESAYRLRNREDLENANVAIRTLKELVDSYPDETKYRAELAHAYRNLAEVNKRENRNREASKAVSDSIQIWESLLENAPESEALRYGLASTLLAANTLGPGQFRRAARAHELTLSLRRDRPDLPRYQALRARSLENLAITELRSGKTTAAERHLQEAARAYAQLHEKSPEVSSYVIRYARCFERLADTKLRAGESEGAIADLQSAQDSLTAAIGKHRSPTALHVELRRLKKKADRIGQTEKKK
ncbi:MAG: hypothetical protein Aurels2KO_15780 [Aureliella sp.]